MTLEAAAVEFLKAHVAWKSTKRATQGLPCTNREPTRYQDGGVLDWGVQDCITEHGPVPDEDADDYCANCQKRGPAMDKRRAALKTYNEARRRAMRLLKKETP